MKTLFLNFFLVPLALCAQGDLLHVGGMTFAHQVKGDSLEISLSAPTTGWVGVGFNNEDNIVGSDLLLFRVQDGKTDVADMFVLGFGDPRSDLSLGGQNSVRIIEGIETHDQTSVRFRLALPSGDKYDFRHEVGKEFWLILAYSTHDDFAHHSRMRKHLKHRF